MKREESTNFFYVIIKKSLLKSLCSNDWVIGSFNFLQGFSQSMNSGRSLNFFLIIHHLLMQQGIKKENTYFLNVIRKQRLMKRIVIGNLLFFTKFFTMNGKYSHLTFFPYHLSLIHAKKEWKQIKTFSSSLSLFRNNNFWNHFSKF
jgi:hypothetical protein